VVNSCWLATAHARLAQTSHKIFKQPQLLFRSS
jgi:hypothetical protein